MKPHDLANVEPLVASLLARAPRMSFMQLCRLLEVRALDHPGLGTRDTPEHEPVRFGSWPRVGFPAGEVATVEYRDALDDYRPPAPPIVRTTFMGLYGVDAAMPPHMIDDIVLREEGHEAVEAFLDRFHHRFVMVLYRAWKKYRYPESFRPAGSDAHSRNLLCLVGFGWGRKPERAGVPDSRMLALLGLLCMKTPHARRSGGCHRAGRAGCGRARRRIFPRGHNCRAPAAAHFASVGWGIRERKTAGLGRRLCAGPAACLSQPGRAGHATSRQCPACT
jgi:type VI secretion system protein ImpH